MNFDTLVELEESNNGEDEVVILKDILPIPLIMEELQSTDIMYKLSYIGGDMLQRLASKVNNLRQTRVEEDNMESYFTEDEKAYLYGCYLLSQIPKELADARPMSSKHILNIRGGS